MEELKRN